MLGLFRDNGEENGNPGSTSLSLAIAFAMCYFLVAMLRQVNCDMNKKKRESLHLL